MIALCLFLSLWIGLLFKKSFITFGILTVIFLIYLAKKYTKNLMILCLVTFGVGVGISYLNIEYSKTDYKGIVIDSKDNYYLLDSFGERLYVYEKNNDKEIGDIVHLYGNTYQLDFVTLESEFDFNEYLNDKGVYKKINVTHEETLFENPIKIKKIRNGFLANFDEDTSSVLGAILFSNSLNSEETTFLKNLNISRLLNFSGVYIYFLYNFIYYLFRKVFKEKTSEILSLTLLSFYSIFTFPKFTIIRILFIKFIKLINKYRFNESISYLTILGITGLFFLIIDYHLAYQTSFQLGYLFSLNAYLLNPIFSRRKKVKETIYNFIATYFFFIPFEISFNYCINPLGYLVSILISPLFLLLGLVGFLCFFKIPIYVVANFLVKTILSILNPVSFISLRLYGPEFNGIFLLIYYGLYYAFLYYAEIDFKPIMKHLKIINFALLAIYFLPIKNTLTNQVSFINVGQGDCCLIRSGNDVALIDTGGLVYKDLATSSLIPYFRKNRIYNIDLVMITHEDNDHDGALYSLKKNFKVKRVVRSKDAFPIKMNDLIFTNYNVYFDENSLENDKSLVIGFSLMDLDFLIMGDAPIDIEKKIMLDNESIPCDILKIGHHGSETSSSKEFIKYVSPKEGIVSVGKNNSYNHPRQSVLNILQSCGVTIRRTDLEGTITYSNYKFL